jgi:hypothetical protein
MSSLRLATAFAIVAAIAVATADAASSRRAELRQHRSRVAPTPREAAGDLVIRDLGGVSVDAAGHINPTTGPGSPAIAWQVEAEPEFLESIPRELRAFDADPISGAMTIVLRVAPGDEAAASRIAAMIRERHDAWSRGIERGGVPIDRPSRPAMPQGNPDPCLDPCLLYSGDGAGNLYSIDPLAGTSTFIGNMGITMFDIAASTDQRLYGLSPGSLYLISACNATTTFLGSSAGGNGLTGDLASDDLFAQGPPLERIPLPVTSPISVGGACCGAPPLWCGGSSGDLSQSGIDSRLYSSVGCGGCNGDTLIAIDPATGSALQQIGCLRDAITLQGLSGVYGIAHDCQCRLFAGLSGGNVIYEVDEATGLGVPHVISGGYDGTFGFAEVPHACLANQPPSCDAAADPPACWTVQLHANAVDPDGDALTYAWTTLCAGASFAPGPTDSDPLVTVDPGCRTCTFTLVVDDGHGGECHDSVTVFFDDGVPPVVNCPPDAVAECDGLGNDADRQAWLAQFSASDDCGPVTTTTTIVPGVLAGTITYEDFCDLSALTLNGSAAAIQSCVPPPCDPVMFGGQCVLRLTNDLGQGGSAFTTAPITLAADASFSTFFSFQITDNQDCGGMGGADGIVFVVQTDANNVGGLGVGIGYAGINDSVGIEFDTWDNGAIDDFNGNHLGIDLNGDVDSVVLTPISPDFNNLAIWYAWVDYDGTTDRLEARVSQVATRPALPQAALVVDLVSVLGQTDAFVGFTSGTGCAGGDHDIRSWVLNNSFNPIGCAGTGVETVTFSAEDACGNESSCVRTFTIADTTPPEMIGCPADQQVSCSGPVPDPAAVTALDACDPDTPVTLAQTEAAGPCPDERTITRTWTAVDDCGNQGTCVQVISVVDDTPPVLAGCAPDVRMDCGGAAPPLPAVSAVDDCDPDPAIDFDENRVDGPCPGTYVLTRTWTARDRCGNESSCTQVVTAEDTTPPTIDASMLVSCLWPPNHGFVDIGLSGAATDNCAAPGDIVLSVTSVTSDEATATELGAGGPTHCPDAIVDGHSVLLRAERSGRADGRVYRITLTAADPCGNIAQVVKEVHVPHDQDPKTPGQVPGNDPAGTCPAIDGGAIYDATTCN